MKKNFFLILKIVISVGILYFLFRGMDLNAFVETVSKIKPISIVIAVVVIFTIQCISTLRWKLLLKKDFDASYFKLFSMYLIGMFFNNFLPTLVGGDLIKTYYLYKQTGKGSVALASIFLDRYAGFTALIFNTVIALIFGYYLLEGTGLMGFFLILVAGYVCASLVIWVDFMHRWAMSIMSKIHMYGINHKIDEFYKVLMGYKGHMMAFYKAFGLSIIIQAGVVLAYFALGWGIGMKLSVGYYFLFVPLATVASMVPISLAGLGVREGIFIYLFTKAGASQEEALSLSLLFFFATLIVSVLGGIEYVRIGGKKAMEGSEDMEVSMDTND
ncbi:MAG: flippase-like domain-containing protein [Proteobacteria bacterium]|nr:flippase-like domain-containing protein [Pseudomonadota bacterium]